MNTILKVGLLIIRDKKFLVNRKYGTSIFLMPGGKPQAGESEQDALIREIHEEHGVELVRDSIRHFCDYKDMAVHEPNTTLLIKIYQGTIIGEPQCNSEIEEQKWIGKNDDISLCSPTIQNQIMPALIDQQLI